MMATITAQIDDQGSEIFWDSPAQLFALAIANRWPVEIQQSNECLQAARALPDGWKLVPYEPTKEMRVEMDREYEYMRDTSGVVAPAQIWRVAYNAAPPPAAVRGEGLDADAVVHAIVKSWAEAAVRPDNAGTLAYLAADAIGSVYRDKPAPTSAGVPDDALFAIRGKVSAATMAHERAVPYLVNEALEMIDEYLQAAARPTSEAGAINTRPIPENTFEVGSVLCQSCRSIVPKIGDVCYNCGAPFKTPPRDQGGSDVAQD
jgi:hypothetical protein